MVYVKVMDPTSYSKIEDDLWNEYLKGQINYPKSITAAYQLQTKYWKQRKNSKNNKIEMNCHFSVIQMLLATNVERRNTFHQIIQIVV